MSKQSLVIVESPTKAKTIRKFLPKTFLVEASMGHVRDLPQSAADIPESLKKEDWAKIGVNVDKNFEPLYVVPKGKSKIITELRRKMKDAEAVYLATDEDREGESISWHLLELLKPKVPVKRMVFHEITKAAIEQSIRQCRDLDMRLVRAQETRRILDRLVGYTLSPLLWKKIAYGLSAGRVQSVALRMIVDRERDRLKFQKANYWDIEGLLKKNSDAFTARLYAVQGTRIASGKDFDENTGKIATGKDVRVLDEKVAQELATKLKSAVWTVQSVDEKDVTSRPSIPFITSTLQQEGNRKLGLSARDTMRMAQRLYEEGLITYMRTDSPSLSQEAIKAARSCVEQLYGRDYLSPEPRQFSSKSKGAQEAHEAIRPSGVEFVHPKDTGLSGKELALYDLIWKRTVACQMAEAKKKSSIAKIEAEGCVFTASGTRILFPGFLRAYVEGSDDPEAALEDKEVALPELKPGEKLSADKVQALSHETKPPARFTEAALVQALEKAGVGRPSTYASIIGTITERGYVRKTGNSLTPTFTGFAVIQLLERNFEKLVDPNFTSKMEESLDDIAEGNLEWLPYLKQFYLGKEGLRSQVDEKEKKIDANESRCVNLPHLKEIQVKIGRFGPYVVLPNEKGAAKSGAAEESSAELHASIPEDIAPADLSAEKTKELLEIQARGPQPLGQDPKTGESIYCLVGRFGPYVQLGQVTEEKPKPKRASIPKGVDPKTVTIEMALHYLSLPRDLGVHPTSGKPIQSNLGRFGPYVVHDGDFRSLKKEDNVYTVDLKRALEILAEEKRSSRAKAAVLKELGEHPEDKKPVVVYDGKYGPYVKHGDTNASLPRDLSVDAITIARALELLAERIAKGGGAAKKTKTAGAPKAKRVSKKAAKDPDKAAEKP